jgi:hypothetical protein
MTITVYKVDGQTRLFLPDSSWGSMVLLNLRRGGHSVVACEDQTMEPDPRSANEL